MRNSLSWTGVNVIEMVFLNSPRLLCELWPLFIEGEVVMPLIRCSAERQLCCC